MDLIRSMYVPPLENARRCRSLCIAARVHTCCAAEQNRPKQRRLKKKRRKKRVFESVPQRRKRPEAECMFSCRRVYLLVSLSATSVALQSY